MYPPYLFYERFNIEDVEALRDRMKRVLIVEQDRHLAELYTAYLEHLPLDIAMCCQSDLLHEGLLQHRPHITIVSTDILFGLPKRQFTGLRNDYPLMHIIAVGGSIERELLHELMNIGVSSYINRHFTQPRDMIEAVTKILSVAF